MYSSIARRISGLTTEVTALKCDLQSVGLAIVFVIGCGQTGPLAPPPKTGYHTKMQTYVKSLTPNIPVVNLKECVFSNEDTLVQKMNLPQLIQSGTTYGFIGTVVHPDKRMIGGSVIGTLVSIDQNGAEMIVDQCSGNCKGVNGRLKFEFEFRFIKGPSRDHKFRVVYHGFRPGQDANGPIQSWAVPFAEHSVEIEDKK